MYTLGIVLAFIMTLSKVIDTIINKRIVETSDPVKHSMNRIIIVMPILMIFALSNWYISSKAILLIVLFGLVECFNIVFHQASLKYLKTYTADIISKSKVILVLVIAIGLGISDLNLFIIGGTFIFFFGVILIIDFANNLEEKRSNLLGIILQTLSVICRSAKPFIIKSILVDQLASNEVVVFLSMPISFIILWIVFRKKPSINKQNIKIYLYQAFFVATSMLLMGYAVYHSSEITVSIIEAFSGAILLLYSIFILKEKSTIKRFIGMTLTIIGLIVIVITSA